MKNINIKKIFLSLFILFSFITPVLSFAASSTVAVTDKDVKVEEEGIFTQIMKEEGKYLFIAPFGPFTDYANDTVDLKKSDALGNYLKIWFKFLIGVGGVIGVVRLIMAGFEIITKSDNIDAMKRAKQEITAIVSSLVLVALSWVILNSLNPELVEKSLIIPSTTSTSTAPKGYYADENGVENNFPGVTKKGFYFKVINKTTKRPQYVYADYISEARCLALAKTYVNPTFTIETDKCYDFTDLDMSAVELEKRDILRNGGVIIKNRGVCKNPYTDCNCTYVAGLHDTILQRVVAIGKAAGATLWLTAGAEKCAMVRDGKNINHAEHGPTEPFSLDLRYNKDLINFLEDNARLIAPIKNSSSNKRYKYDGLWWANEPLGTKNSGIHFHVGAPRGVRDSNNSLTYDLSQKYLDAHCKSTEKDVPGGKQIVCK